MNWFKSDEQYINDFAKLMVKLRAEEFIGLAKVLCVHVFDNDTKDENGKPAPRAAEAIIEDCLTRFSELSNKKRREILRVMRAAVGGK